MSKARIVLNSAGVRELLKSPGIAAAVEARAAAMAGRCGEGYAHDVKQLSTRVVASAYTATPEAMRENLRDNTLLRAMEEVRET